MIISTVLFLIAMSFFIITFGVHSTIMMGDPSERPEYTRHPILKYLPAISGFVLSVISLSMILHIHWIWLIILNFFLGLLFSRWLTNAFLVRFASSKGLGINMLIAFTIGLISFVIGLIYTNGKNYDNSYHTDPNYKYEYRKGITGNYTYNYDVIGIDEEGNSVTGNVDMHGKYGSGLIINDFGNEIEVEVEWINSGELTATDYDGNVYELEVE